MTVLLVQNNRAMAAFTTASRRDLSATDITRAEALAATVPALEEGYYDVLLIRGKVSNEQFLNWASQLPHVIYNGARDAVICVR